MRSEVRDPLKPVIERAVELSRQPNDTARESGTGLNVATYEDVATTDDGNGNTIHPFITNLDVTNDLNAVTMP